MRILDCESVLHLVATGCTTGRVVAALADSPTPGEEFCLREDSALAATGDIVRVSEGFSGPVSDESLEGSVTWLPGGTPVRIESVALAWKHLPHLTPVGRWVRVEQTVVSVQDPENPLRRLTGTLMASDLRPVEETRPDTVRSAA